MGRVCLVACASACVFVCGAACGDSEPPIPPDTAQSGTRLKVTWLEFDDGTRTWTTDIFDSALGLPCTPLDWTDGALRCTPPAARVYFADAGCTQPMLLDREAERAIEYLEECGVRRPSTMYRPSAEPVTVSVLFQRDSEDSCSPVPGTPMTGVTGVRAVEEPPDLVELTRRYQGGGRLRIETLASSDGFLLPIQPYDSELGVACINFDNIVLNTNGMADMTSVPCVLPAAEADFFVDITCETPGLWSSEDAACAPPPIAAVDTERQGACRDYVAIDDEPAQLAFNRLGDSCYETQPPLPETLIYGATGPIEPMTFARATGTAPTVGRLQLIYIGDGTTRIRERAIFYDTELDTECQLVQEDVDTWSCKPVSRTSDFSALYLDEACTQPVEVVFVNNNDDVLWPCTPHKPRRYTGYGTDFRLVGDVHPGPFYQSTPELGCFLLEVVNSTAHSVGPTITATYPRATKRHD